MNKETGNSDDGSLVRPSGKGARGGKAPSAKSTTERERHLEAQVKDLQQQLAKPAPAAGQGEAETVAVDDVEMDTAESKVNALRSQIKDLKADLVWANSLDPRRQNLLAGGLEGYTAAVQQQLDSTVEQLEGCKTPSQHMAAAQQREAKCIKAEKAAADLAASAKLALQLATTEAQEAAQALQIAKDELSKASAEVGALAAQRANGVFPATPLADTHNDAPPGFIREDCATRLWVEREQNIQSLIAEAVATALARQQGQSSATPSEAATDDAPVLSELDWFADDDSSWAKLDKGKRKALVNRERAEMAASSRPPSSNVRLILSPLSRLHASSGTMRERNTQPMAVLWDRWRGIRIGEARVPGPFDFDDPDAQPSEQEGNSGDDWQWVGCSQQYAAGWQLRCCRLCAPCGRRGACRA